MIEDLLKDDNIIERLNTSKFKFYLGGSRRMNQKAPNLIKINNDTDWDFYAENDKGVIKELVKLGVVATGTDSVYFDDECLGIMKYDKDIKVQVVVRRDPMFYRMVFESITPEFYYNYLWKRSPCETMNPRYIREIFNQLFRTANWKTK